MNQCQINTMGIRMKKMGKLSFHPVSPLFVLCPILNISLSGFYYRVNAMCWNGV